MVHRSTDNIPDPSTEQPSRVAVDETAVRVNGDLCWVYTAIDLDTKQILEAQIFKRHGTVPAAAFSTDSVKTPTARTQCF